MRFYLGLHEPAHMTRTAVPMFVSRRRLQRRKVLPAPAGPWALDSGGFSELTQFGRWVMTAEQYAAFVRRCRDEMPGLQWAAPQDWMVEPIMLRRTGLDVAGHQRLTVDNYIDLRSRAADLPFVPALQGQTLDDYRRHVDQYASRGVVLADLDLVGLGSVCRRQATASIVPIVTGLAADGLRLHGFGMKVTGLQRIGHLMSSADSMAWSFTARREQLRLDGCTHRATDCRECLTYALHWRQGLIDATGSEGA